MSSLPSLSDQSLSPSQILRREAVCDPFEAKWQAGRRPVIEDCLNVAPAADRAPLLSALLDVELECRVNRGERPTLEEYAARFPDDGELIAAAFRKLGEEATAGTPADPTTGPEAASPPDAGAGFTGPGPDAAISGGRTEIPGGTPPSIPGYKIDEVLGRGGMGIVYKARHLTLKRTVALKMILAGGHADHQKVARFRAEAEAVARLQHPNIVQVFDVGEHNGLPFCALEYVEGDSLAKRLAGRPLPAREAARLVEPLAGAMHLAHSRNVVHRDLKPANVLLTREGTAKVTDFGLARLLDDDSGQTRLGDVMGTPSYMAPEQASGHTHAAGPLADVYALGAILYECLTGRPPFKGTTPRETLEQVRSAEPVAPRLLSPGVPRDLETICLKCLQKEPGKRYATAEALANDLRRFLDGKPIEARPTRAWERGVKWARRKPVAAALVVAVALALLAPLGVAVVAVSQRNRAVKAESDLQERLAISYADAGDLAVQRGSWRTALENYELALKAGHPDSLGLRLNKVRAWMAINDLESAKTEVAALAREPALGDYAGPVLLLQGDLLLGEDDDRAKEFIRRARKLKLSEAEEAYAQALLATNTTEAVTHLQHAIASDPYHQDARAMASLLLIVLGRTDEAREQVVVSQALFPEDPGFKLFRAILWARQGNHREANRLLDEMGKQLGEEQVSALRSAMEFWKSLEDWDPAVDDQRQIDVGALVAKVAPFTKRFLLLGGGAPGAPKELGAVSRAWRLPPAVARGFGQGVQLFMQVTLAQNADDKSLAEMKGLLQTHPEGTLYYLYATMLLMRGQFAEAVEPYRLAAETPAFLPVRRQALEGAIMTEGLAGSPKREKPDLALRMRAAGHLRERLALGPPKPSLFHPFCKVAIYAGDWELARRVIDAWEKQKPDDVGYLSYRGTVELKTGAYGQAVNTAKKILAKEPGNTEATQLLKEALEKYGEEAKGLGFSETKP